MTTDALLCDRLLARLVIEVEGRVTETNGRVDARLELGRVMGQVASLTTAQDGLRNEIENLKRQYNAMQLKAEREAGRRQQLETQMNAAAPKLKALYDAAAGLVHQVRCGRMKKPVQTEVVRLMKAMDEAKNYCIDEIPF